jgi:hypothetical protein
MEALAFKKIGLLLSSPSGVGRLSNVYISVHRYCCTKIMIAHLPVSNSFLDMGFHLTHSQVGPLQISNALGPLRVLKFKTALCVGFVMYSFTGPRSEVPVFKLHAEPRDANPTYSYMYDGVWYVKVEMEAPVFLALEFLYTTEDCGELLGVDCRAFYRHALIIAGSNQAWDLYVDQHFETGQTLRQVIPVMVRVTYF